ncbi:cytochrome c nitrite reductase subunit NrfD [Phytobacter sp. AG2a]
MFNAFHFDTLVWDWPIAIYLLLVGISAGMITLTMLLKYYVPAEYSGKNPIVMATAIVAPLSVMVGLIILIFHLTRPTAFWHLLVFYNPDSIMSLGVMLFQVYFVFIFLWLVSLYRDELLRLVGKFNKGCLFSLVRNLSAILQKRRQWFENMLLVLAVLLGCYTGFLLSALKSFPMLNNPVLPLLFLASGTTSGIAVAMLVGAINQRFIDVYKGTLHFIHKIENPVIFAEIFLLFAFFVGLLLGDGHKNLSAHNALSGFWGGVFWIGVIGTGIAVPLVAGFLRTSRKQMAFSATLSLIGVFLLRMFVLYAGQMTVA